ncbi:SIMPL domain-containing protein [Ramlibacter tataouinensis]|uniref:SIMPL domain-containing protein n=1 Tax=Ramlibacter tataouinensis TaxID=94132 RepID=UPI0022F3EBF5|nr:SIMPL domain-containing protein [Ramlibacter tataouinensis]WBY02282.1 SIMPL domain-containing protein [Ramlibacter tataouinensis]
MSKPSFIHSFHRPLAAAALLVVCMAPAMAQLMPVPAPAPENVVQLSASAAVEVPQDLLSMQLAVTREGADPAQVQSQLKSVLDQALAEARKAAQPGALDVRTGTFQVGPRYGREGRITSWVGTAELQLEGTDFARIGQVAGRLPGMNMTGASFRLSRERRLQAERDAQAQAVERFRTKAGELAKAFGFAGYGLREVSVHAQDEGSPPRPRMMAMEAKSAMADAPVPVEAGKSAVVVNVSGSVQLR